jgi:hypothetical protein
MPLHPPNVVDRNPRSSWNEALMSKYNRCPSLLSSLRGTPVPAEFFFRSSLFPYGSFDGSALRIEVTEEPL